ncbi:MAG: toast rack family protein [Thermanaerothrix sp.]|nr:toast rack family protein [Thermanaerothrix sp.]
MRKYAFLIWLGLLMLLALACTIELPLPEIKMIAPQTYEVNEPYPNQEPAELLIRMGAGELTLSGGANNLVEGKIEYNVEGWAPKIQREGREVRIEQGVKSASFSRGVQNLINRWELELGDRPIDFALEAGAYDGNLDFSEVPLTRLKISDGASKVRVVFNVPNPEVMRSFTYETGASNITLKKLANANFEEMTFKGGAGNFTLDFSGKLQRDARVWIDSGLGNMTIIVPADANCRIVLSSGLTNISTEGTWTILGQEYRTMGEGPQLRIDINVGVGNLKLVSE